ncbi:histidinol-phosphate transaminase [Synergistes jonesii]|uniref:Histidinol-phosphate aminotransferase n=1 Tax=Synergistes jonesii TaxID=2754 RepID=A0A073ISI0_9BACT|nr:histidinol-phosphate transaminase [Synergistes jonesii]KEJ92421.1 hypothetical protein EH55_03760 [Synergistes jonesii]OFB63059.1 hypothetical protein JS73_06125 [Synergistes jonesii]OFB63933.1 hypothetical protein JS79_06650 [Synergistes jonesii]OFB65866.1 hypothetical protein JS72_00575 [Synergistes jonesii]OFB67800.1 hypothetical protein JS78_06135 [Synergistes jonesii]
MPEDLKEYFEKLTRPSVRNVAPYDAAPISEPKIILSANENNAGVPKGALEAMRAALEKGNRYPDSRNTALRKKLAARFGLAPEQIITSNGLDGMFTMLSRAFLDKGDEVVCGECTFGVYASNAAIAGAKVVKVPLSAAFEQEPAKFAEAVTPATKMLFFCNPNNPTGTLAETAGIRAMLGKIPRHVIVILDQAYAEFSGADDAEPFSLLKDFPNLMICRTFSKIFALAGLRVGWGAAHPMLIDCLYRVREPYCVTAAAEAGASAALDEEAFLSETRTRTAEEREKLSAVLKERGIRFVPSRANFILMFPGEKGDALRTALEEKGIAARFMTCRGMPAVRLSIGLPEENKEVEKILRSL